MPPERSAATLLNEHVIIKKSNELVFCKKTPYFVLTNK